MIMKYKGYIGNVIYDEDAHLFRGEIVNAKSIITFQGRSVDELEQAIRDSVEDYLEWCKERGEQPDKPYSGQLKLRMPPALHAKLAAEASVNNIRLNTLILQKLSDE